MRVEFRNGTPIVKKSAGAVSTKNALQNSVLNNMPRDLIILIFQFTDAESFRQITRTCLALLALRNNISLKQPLNQMPCYPAPYFFAHSNRYCVSAYPTPAYIDSILFHNTHYFVGSYKERAIRVIDSETGIVRATMDPQVSGNVTALATNTASSVIASAHGKAGIVIWGAHLNIIKKIERTFGGSAMTCLALTADGQHIYSGHENGGIALWNIGSGQPIFGAGAQSRTIRTLSLSSSETRLISASSDGTACIWTLNNQMVVRTFNLKNPVFQAEFTKDSRYIVAGTQNGRNIEDALLHIWDATTYMGLHTIKTGFAMTAFAITQSDDNKALIFAIANRSCSPLFRDSHRDKQFHRYDEAKNDITKRERFLSELRTSLKEPALYVFDCESGTCLLKKTIRKNPAWVNELIRSDDETLFSKLTDHTALERAEIWNTPIGIAIQSDVILLTFEDSTILRYKIKQLICDAENNVAETPSFTL